MAWRTPLALQIIFIVVIGLGINFFPESPRWLMKVGREQEARNVLRATRDSDVEYELKGIKKVVKFELETLTANHYWAMLFPKDKYARQLRWRVVLAVWLQIMQELVGIGVITVYAVDLFQNAGFGLQLSKLLAGFNNLSYMFSVIFAVFTLDRYGRRGRSEATEPWLHRTLGTDANAFNSNYGLGSSGHGSDSPDRRYSRQICAGKRSKSTSVRRRRCYYDLLIHRYIWRNLAHNSLALPHGDLPTQCSSKRWSLVGGRLVHWQRCHHDDHPIPLSSHQLWYIAVALWSQHILPAIRHPHVP